MSFSHISQTGFSCFPKSNQSYGFTLLEVLIAMVVFGMAVTMLLSSMNSQGRAHVNISLRTVAHWVAMNQMAEVRMQEEWPNVGTTRGDAEMRNHKWYWLQTVSKTTDKDLRQVEVEVRYDEKDELPTTRFVGFIANKDATGESGTSRRNTP